MWLINTTTLRVELKVNDREIPPYAILSHTWGEEEVTHQDMVSAPDAAKEKAGYAKIAYTCKQAQEHGLQYAWVDTCCIDKKSSAELSEAINSMYHWYQRAVDCYVYLSDVPTPSDGSVDNSRACFIASRWFTRGWTLQELIAPSKVIFYSSSWDLLGYLADLATTVSEITNIDIKFLCHMASLDDFSIAQRMSWAAERQTSRTEDEAYCLLGLFDINMPLLYGEGRKAFVRLQEEIIKTSTDQSILAWEDQISRGIPFGTGKLFAPAPSYFRGSGGIKPIDRRLADQSYTMTNRGLEISLTQAYVLRRGGREKMPINNLWLLDCCEHDHLERALALNLSSLGNARDVQPGRLKRINLVLCGELEQRSIMTILRQSSIYGPFRNPLREFVRLEVVDGCEIIHHWPPFSFDRLTNAFRPFHPDSSALESSIAAHVYYNGRSVLLGISWRPGFQTMLVRDIETEAVSVGTLKWACAESLTDLYRYSHPSVDWRKVTPPTEARSKDLVFHIHQRAVRDELAMVSILSREREAEPAMKQSCSLLRLLGNLPSHLLGRDRIRSEV